jgi:hypothetical protein
MEWTTYSDGSRSLTPSRFFSDDAHIIPRSSGTDVAEGGKIFRFDPQHPETMHDLSSAAYFKELDGYATICSRGGKSKRLTTKCFSKIIKQSTDHRVLLAQAVEHVRLYPSKGNPPLVVHNHRIYRCPDPVQPCTPQGLTAPLAFKAKTTGQIMEDKQFGFPYGQAMPGLEDVTKVVKIESTVEHIEDARDVRAFMIKVPGKYFGENTYLVAEADAGLFYYCNYDANKITGIEFKKIDPINDIFGRDLIKRYSAMKDPIIRAVPQGTLPTEDFIILPPMSEFYDRMIATGSSSSDVDTIKKALTTFSAKEQREFAVDTWNRQNFRGVEVAIPAIKIEPIVLPSGFSALSTLEQNKVYADGAREQVDAQLSATGLGPANQNIPKNPQDTRRLKLTRPMVMWEYSKSGSPNSFNSFLKAGSGNCDQMAGAAAAIVKEQGGNAAVWQMPGHVFALVGGPRRGLTSTTYDFSESIFRDAWVADPWAGITCKAIEYKQLLKDKMAEWSKDGKELLTVDWSRNPPEDVWLDPLDQRWMRNIDQPKRFSY